MDTIRAKKNWNSHGATLGLAISQLSSIISSLGMASKEEIKHDINEIIPYGVVINMEMLTQFVQNTW